MFFDLPYLSSQSMQIVLCKLSYTSENGGREPVPTLCECKPRPSTRLTTDESNLLIVPSLPPITDIASDAKYIDYGTIICCSFSRCKSGTVRACRGAFCPPPNFPGINCTKRNSHWMFCKHCHHQMYRITKSFLMLIMYLSKRAGPQKRGRNESAQ